MLVVAGQSGTGRSAGVSRGDGKGEKDHQCSLTSFHYLPGVLGSEREATVGDLGIPLKKQASILTFWKEMSPKQILALHFVCSGNANGGSGLALTEMFSAKQSR